MEPIPESWTMGQLEAMREEEDENAEQAEAEKEVGEE